MLCRSSHETVRDTLAVMDPNTVEASMPRVSDDRAVNRADPVGYRRERSPARSSSSWCAGRSASMQRRCPESSSRVAGRRGHKPGDCGAICWAEWIAAARGPDGSLPNSVGGLEGFELLRGHGERGDVGKAWCKLAGEGPPQSMAVAWDAVVAMVVGSVSKIAH